MIISKNDYIYILQKNNYEYNISYIKIKIQVKNKKQKIYFLSHNKSNLKNN